MPDCSYVIAQVMLRLPEALRRRMRAEQHTQMDVSSLTGVPQSQISKALNGRRKRLTQPMIALCQYAGLETTSNHPPALAELTQILQMLVEGNPAAAACIKDVLQGLAPLVAGAPLKRPH